MHPASSLIYFTVASGFGFGLLFFLGLGALEVEGWHAFWAYAVGYGLAVTGLCSSLLHLGNPQRAWKALSQWRTSWLSREGVVAVSALSLLAPVALSQIFLGPNIAWLGLLGAAMSGATVYCTAMIYGQLKTVPRWQQPFTPLVFLAFAFLGGALLVQNYGFTIFGLMALFIFQIGHWFWGDRQQNDNASSIKTATGLGGSDGTVRLLERPHTGKNYLTTEMVHVIARKHVIKLRAFVLGLIFIVAGMVVLMPEPLWIVGFVVLGGAALVSRWLFFAEAEHVVGLYYGRSNVG